MHLSLFLTSIGSPRHPSLTCGIIIRVYSTRTVNTQVLCCKTYGLVHPPVEIKVQSVYFSGILETNIYCQVSEEGFLSLYLSPLQRTSRLNWAPAGIFTACRLCLHRYLCRTIVFHVLAQVLFVWSTINNSRKEMPPIISQLALQD